MRSRKRVEGEAEFELGDRVRMSCGGEGVVVGVIERGEFAPCLRARNWMSIGKGVLIQSNAGEVIHYREPGIQLSRLG